MSAACARHRGAPPFAERRWGREARQGRHGGHRVSHSALSRTTRRRSQGGNAQASEGARRAGAQTCTARGRIFGRPLSPRVAPPLLDFWQAPLCSHQRATSRMVVAGSQSVQALAPHRAVVTHRSMRLSRLPAGAARALPSQLRLLSACAVEANGASASNDAAAIKRVPPPPPSPPRAPGAAPVSPASASTPSAFSATFDKVYTAPRAPLPDVLKLLPQEVAAHCHASDEASTRWAELQSESELLEEGACRESAWFAPSADTRPFKARRACSRR